MECRIHKMILPQVFLLIIPFLFLYQKLIYFQPTKLQEVDAPIQTQDTCSAAFAALGYYSIPGFPPVAIGMVCAGITGMQPCFGDSGGPLTTREENQHKLVGTVSFGICSNDVSFFLLQSSTKNH